MVFVIIELRQMSLEINANLTYGGRTMLNKIREKAEEISGRVIEWRHYFHQHPEVSWEEFGTTAKIAEILEEMGYSNVRTGVADSGTGVVADLNAGRSGKCILLRADIDALPVKEEADVEYRSLNDGVMHACGHDSHIAMLLGAAKLLIDMKDDIPGKIRLIFQPAEESPKKSGADTMVKEGVLEGVDAAFGLHIWSPVPSGKVVYTRGPLMASADAFYVKIQGRGGHGAMPHLGVDPTIAACQTVMSLQTILSREIDPLDSAVISTGEIKAGNAFNVIPDTVTMNGTVRAFEPSTREYVAGRIEEIVRDTCRSLRCVPEFTYKYNLPSTINDPDFADLAANTVAEMFGKENVYETKPTMGAEDFSFILREVPGAFMFLGTGDPEKKTNYPHHHPMFKVDDEVLVTGIAALTGVALQYLGK